MKNITLVLSTLVLALFFTACQKDVSTPTVQKEQKTREDIRIFSSDNSDGKITVKSIEKSFETNGFTITGNNNMNAAFEARFGAGKDFKMYRLMFVYSPKLSARILKDYPEFGLISPLSTSLYSKDGSTISIASLSLTGMSRISGVPVDNPDLIKLSEGLTKALKQAFPNGEESDDIEDAKETYQETMEGEIESAGFIVAGFTSIIDDLEANDVDSYEFYDGYSICKLEVIYPVHKLHPEVGAFAPCTMYMYKKKGEKFTRMGYPSVYNWVMSTNIYDDGSLEPLIDAQNQLESTIDSTIE